MAMYRSLPPNGGMLIYDLTCFGRPEVPYFAVQNLPFSSAPIPLHLHKKRMEINYFFKGERAYRVGGREYFLRGNDVFAVWPDEPHGSGNYPSGRGTHFWLQIALPEPGAGFLGFGPEQSDALIQALWGLPRRHFQAEPQLRDIFIRILSICRDEAGPLAGIHLTARLIELFLLVIDYAGQGKSAEITPDIAKALDLMRRNLNGRPTIAELARVSCLSESRFKRKFREQMGIPPMEYLLRKRLDWAAEHILSGRRTLTEMALTLGFSSGQHFSSTFKRFFGKSPLAWRKEQIGQNTAEPSPPDLPNADTVPWRDADGVLQGYLLRDE